jgi:hypothetical protein
MMYALASSAVLAVLGPVADAPSAAPSRSLTAPDRAGNPSGAAPQSEDPRVTERVKTEFLAWQRGELDRSTYTTAAAEQFNDDAVETMSGHLKPLGALLTTTAVGQTKQANTTIYVYWVRCQNGNVRMKLGLDKLGKICDISFQPER